MQLLYTSWSEGNLLNPPLLDFAPSAVPQFAASSVHEPPELPELLRSESGWLSPRALLDFNLPPSSYCFLPPFSFP